MCGEDRSDVESLDPFFKITLGEETFIHSGLDPRDRLLDPHPAWRSGPMDLFSHVRQIEICREGSYQFHLLLDWKVDDERGGIAFSHSESDSLYEIEELLVTLSDQGLTEEITERANVSAESCFVIAHINSTLLPWRKTPGSSIKRSHFALRRL